jgi:hypothetical protein
MTAEESLRRAEELLDRLERARAELEKVSESGDADAAIEILTELAEIAKDVEAQLGQAKRDAETEAQ